MRQVKDQLGREVRLKAYPPQRIISIVPSQTELLFDLGLRDEVVGITKFCIHPEEWFRTKTRVGGTKLLHIETIRALQPDLIIAGKEENVQGQVAEIEKEFPVWVSDVKTMEDCLSMIASLGRLVQKEAASEKLIGEIEKGLAQLTFSKLPKRVAYLIWYNPLMTVGADTFINTILETIGWKNLFADKTRYPEITMNDLAAMNPDLVLLSSEPFPFKEKHLLEISSQLPGIDIKLVDGEMFSWYGSRLLKAIPYLQQL